MATYLKIDGISGNVTTEGYENWINIDTFNFKVKRPVNTNSTGVTFDRTHGILSFSELVLTKKVDQACPLLLAKTCSGDVKQEVYLDVCHTDKTQSRQVRYILKNVLLSDYVTDGISSPDGETGLLETISLNYTQLEMSFIPVGSDGMTGSPINAGYNLTTAKLI